MRKGIFTRRVRVSLAAIFALCNFFPASQLLCAAPSPTPSRDAYIWQRAWTPALDREADGLRWFPKTDVPP